MGLYVFTFLSQDTSGYIGIPADEFEIRWVQLSIFQFKIIDIFYVVLRL